jgi:hypothetical protein
MRGPDESDNKSGFQGSVQEVSTLRQKVSP